MKSRGVAAPTESDVVAMSQAEPAPGVSGDRASSGDTAARARWFALAALGLAMLTIGLDTTILVVALPTMAIDLNANTGALQWFTTAYTLALAAMMLPAGALGDRYGRKKILLAAMLVFGGASLWCALATTPGMLIAARAVLGVAAAAMMPLSMSVLPSLFPDQGQRQRALTIWVTCTALGLPLGPIVGGWLLQHFWWGSVFLVNLPLVVVGSIAVALLVPETRGECASRIDLPGVALSAAGMLGFTYGFIRFGDSGWGDVLAWAAVLGGASVLAGFVWWQRRASHPLIDVALFATRGFSWGTAYSVFLNFAMFGMFFTVPQYFQAVLGVDSFGSGLRLLPLIAGIAVGTRVVDKLLPRLGSRLVLTVGFLIFAAGMGMGAMTQVSSGFGYAAGWTTLVGVAMGLVMPAAMGMAMGELSSERAGSGSALIQALRQGGGTIGVAVLGTVLATAYRGDLGSYDRQPVSDGVNAGMAVARASGDGDLLAQVQSAFVSGMGAMLWLCAAVCLLGAFLAVLFTRRGEPTPGEDADAEQSVHVG